MKLLLIAALLAGYLWPGQLIDMRIDSTFQSDGIGSTPQVRVSFDKQRLEVMEITTSGQCDRGPASIVCIPSPDGTPPTTIHIVFKVTPNAASGEFDTITATTGGTSTVRWEPREPPIPRPRVWLPLVGV